MGRILMFVLFALALVASVLMLFVDSEVWSKVAVIAALWAAFIGAVLVTRYAGALKAERERLRQLDGEHRAELEREKSQFMQREATLESDYNKRLRAARDEHLEQLRAELAQMRRQLAELSGRDLGEEDQRAVRARAERIRELENAAQPPHRPTRPATHQPAHHPAQSSAQSPAQNSTAQPAQQPSAHAKHEPRPQFSTGSFHAVQWSGQDSQETSQLPLVVDTTAMDTPDEEPKRGRRRADESSEGLTVAELMKRFKSD